MKNFSKELPNKIPYPQNLEYKVLKYICWDFF